VISQFYARRKNAVIQQSLSPNSIPKSLPAPVSGWNTRDALDAMEPTDAVFLDNWFPTTGKVTVRPGYTEFATDMSGVASNVDMLAHYESGSTQKFLAACDGTIFDITSGGSASSVKTGFTSNQWQTANFNGRLFLVNGIDAPQDYDGSTMSDTSWSGTGLTITSLKGVNVFKNRLFFWQAGSADFWYAGVNYITGVLTKFPLSRVGESGGNIVTMQTWTLDGGSGIDDYAVFFMSTGEVIVYQGIDPGQNWSLVGRYRIGEPVNIRGVMKLGGDILVTTTKDYSLFSNVYQNGEVGQASKLSGEVTKQAKTNGSLFGWQSTLWPEGNMVVLNVPQADGSFDQHIINTVTSAACRFKDIPARCWAVFNKKCYFGSGDGTVYQLTFDILTDNGSAIDADGRQAWNDFELPQRKLLQAIKVYIESQGSIDYEYAIGFDFNAALTTAATSTTSGLSLWDVALWDVALWAPELVTDVTWRCAGGEGYTISPRVRVSAKQSISWVRTDYRMQIGNEL
jgi:hypothetical protein